MLPVDLHYTPYFFRFAKGVFRKSALLPDESFRKFQVADGMKVLHQGCLGGKRAEKSLHVPAHLGKFDIPVALFSTASVGCDPMQQRRTPFLWRSFCEADFDIVVILIPLGALDKNALQIISLVSIPVLPVFPESSAFQFRFCSGNKFIFCRILSRPANVQTFLPA